MADMGGPDQPGLGAARTGPRPAIRRDQGSQSPPDARRADWAPPTTPPGWAPPPPYPPPPGPSAYGAPYGAPYGMAAPLPKGGDARTGPLPLHPMSVGDVLDGSFKLLKANFRTILLVVASIVVPVQLVSAFLLREQVVAGVLNVLRDPTLAQDQSAFTLGDAGMSLLTAVLSLITAPLIAGAVSRVCAASYLGQQIGPGDALRTTIRRLPALLAASFLVGLAMLGGFMLCILPGIALAVMYTVVTPAMMIEEIGPIEGMRRSWRLVKPRFWGVLGIVAPRLDDLVLPGQPPRRDAQHDRHPPRRIVRVALDRRRRRPVDARRARRSPPSSTRSCTSTVASATRASTSR